MEVVWMQRFTVFWVDKRASSVRDSRLIHSAFASRSERGTRPALRGGDRRGLSFPGFRFASSWAIFGRSSGAKAREANSPRRTPPARWSCDDKTSRSERGTRPALRGGDRRGLSFPGFGFASSWAIFGRSSGADRAAAGDRDEFTSEVRGQQKGWDQRLRARSRWSSR